MASDFTISISSSPIVQITETDQSLYTVSPSKNIAMFVGEFEKGEINKPILISSKLQFKQHFGRALDWNYNQWYQVFNYLEYTNPIWVCRTAGEITAKSSNNGNIANSPGEWGDLLTVVILNTAEYYSNKFIDILETPVQSIIQEHRIDGEWQVLVIRKKQIMEFFSVDNNTEISSLYLESFNLESGEFTLKDGFSDRATLEDLRESTFLFQKDDYDIDIIIGNDFDNNIAIELAEYRKDCIAYIGLPVNIYTFLKVNGKALITENRNPIVTEMLRFNSLTQNNKNKIIDYINNIKRSNFCFFVLGFKQMVDGFDSKKKIFNVAGDVAGLKGLASQKNPWNVGIGMKFPLKNFISTSYYYNQEDKDLFFQLGVNLLIGDTIFSEKMFIDEEIQTPITSLANRNMLNYVERELERISRNFIFEGCDDYTEKRIFNQLTLFFKDVVYDGNISDYKIIVERKNNSFVINIYIKFKFFINIVNLRFINAGTNNISEIKVSE